MNSSNNGTSGTGKVQGNRDKYSKIGIGRGKFPPQLLPICQPGSNNPEMNWQTSTESKLSPKPVSAQQANNNNGNKFQHLRELHLKKYNQRADSVVPVPAQASASTPSPLSTPSPSSTPSLASTPNTIPYQNREINVRRLPGMGMQDADPDYLSLMDRHINNVNDAENESWED